ncbi:MAG: ABC transporter permease, partial [Actinoplanes sp.]
AVLSPVDGLTDELFRMGVLRPGRHTYTQQVPACAAGCTLNSIRIAGGQGSLDVAGQITVHTVDGVDGPATDPARWRATAGGTLAAAPDGLRIDVTSLNGLPSGMFVLPADAPFPLPVATAGIGALPSIGGLDARSLPVTVAAQVPAVPGLGSPAVLADLNYADRLAVDGATTSTAQVWLAAAAPADVVQQLAARGLVITADTRASDVRARLDEQGPALALWFYVIVAVLATALAAGALVLAAAVDRARRIEDLSALRGQGLTRGAVRQATLVTYPVLVGLAVLAGLAIALLGWKLTGWALPLAGEGATALPRPGHPRAPVLAGTGLAVFVVLAGVALAAGRRTLREIS